MSQYISLLHRGYHAAAGSLTKRLKMIGSSPFVPAVYNVPFGKCRSDGMKSFWSRTKLVKGLITILLALAAVLVSAWLYGAYRWNTGTQELRARLDAARLPVRPQTVDFRELEGLPAPVQRYFRLVLKEEQPMVAGVHMHQDRKSVV